MNNHPYDAPVVREWPDGTYTIGAPTKEERNERKRLLYGITYGAHFRSLQDMVETDLPGNHVFKLSEETKRKYAEMKFPHINAVSHWGLLSKPLPQTEQSLRETLVAMCNEMNRIHAVGTRAAERNETIKAYIQQAIVNEQNTGPTGELDATTLDRPKSPFMPKEEADFEQHVNMLMDNPWMQPNVLLDTETDEGVMCVDGICGTPEQWAAPMGQALTNTLGDLYEERGRRRKLEKRIKKHASSILAKKLLR